MVHFETMKTTSRQRSWQGQFPKLAVLITIITVATVWAGPPPITDSCIIDNSCNTCNDSCSTVYAPCITLNLTACTGFVYDYQGNGTLNCTLTSKVCAPHGSGGADCWNITYTAIEYYYYNAHNGCPYCLRAYCCETYATIYDTTCDTSCDPS
jgi:hypothetical protein